MVAEVTLDTAMALDETGAAAGDELWSIGYLEAIIDRRLRILLPGPGEPPELLHRAMSYSLLAPGKRVRPMLTLLTSFHFGRRDLLALDFGCAIEMVHAASLVMDDLPAMDNAELRRGQPTAHREFGEDIALLSCIALLNRAFCTASSVQGLPPAGRIRIVAVLADAIGSRGLVGGQVMDLRLRSGSIRQNDLEQLNGKKTGALFVAAAVAGAIAAGASEDTLAIVHRLGSELGLAFQIADDVLDSVQFAGETGKDTGKDMGKPTLGSLLGPEGARSLFQEHATRCREMLATLGAQEAPLGKFVEQCLARARL
jgi:geranylgeranyl diphosphate synthase type II